MKWEKNKMKERKKGSGCGGGIKEGVERVAEGGHRWC